MINLYRVWAVILRHLYNFRQNLDRLFDSFYWPVMDLLLWGLTFRYVEQSGELKADLILIMLSGLVFWQVIWRAQYEIAVNFLEELWSENLVNLFSTPLRLVEWLLAVLGLGLIKMGITVGLSIVLAWVLYHANLVVYGWVLVPFFASLLMTGWWIGLVVTGFLVLFGRNIQTFAWAGVYILAPFSAIYYPVSSLPSWAQQIAWLVPASHIFEGMRQVLLTGTVAWDKLAVSFGENAVYLIIASIFFYACFKKTLDKGLSRLEY